MWPPRRRPPHIDHARFAITGKNREKSRPVFPAPPRQRTDRGARHASRAILVPGVEGAEPRGPPRRPGRYLFGYNNSVSSYKPEDGYERIYVGFRGRQEKNQTKSDRRFSDTACVALSAPVSSTVTDPSGGICRQSFASADLYRHFCRLGRHIRKSVINKPLMQNLLAVERCCIVWLLLRTVKYEMTVSDDDC